ncbi:MAG TPA: styrene monooxygenase/indole monooxygenase family protein [Herpetosiphonaceae bacterium]|nr:styrene monooxygenase/indole monooxygenase family protein [Herpetosiphonaceae bacterium]
MRRIAIIGSGTAGLMAAHGLLRAGCQVDLYSERSAEQWLANSRPTGTAVRFGLALQHQRELDLEFWDDVTPALIGVNFVLCLRPRTPFLILNGRFAQPARAVDLRLQSARWLDEFERRGGALFIETIDIARLDAIAADHDLTLVASGKGALSDLFPVDAERSVYTRPQRHLSMINVTHANDPRDYRRLPARFYVMPKVGETVWTPYYHMTAGRSMNLFSEAQPGSPLDRFRGVRSGEELLDGYKQMIKDLYPWDYAWARDMRLADPNGWLIGEITPTVRHPVGRLPSGRVVTFVGDAGMAFDPIGAQGANTGIKMARHITQAVARHGSAPFDAPWMQATFDSFYYDQGEPAYRFNNLLLEGLPPAGQEVLAAQHGSDGRNARLSPQQRIADEFCANFSDPRHLTDALADVPKARAVIARQSGGSARMAVLKGRAAIILNQLRWRLSDRSKFGYQHQVWPGEA